jgi:hypothetical protein
MCEGGTITVQPKTKIRALIFGLVLPYFAIVMYFVLRMQEQPLPTWFPYFGLSYLLATMILVTAFSRKVARNAQPQSVQRSQPVRRLMLRAWAGYLVAVWCGGLLWGFTKRLKAIYSGSGPCLLERSS